MKKLYLLAAIRKNGFLVYKNSKSKDLVIRKKGDFKNADAFKKLLVTFTSKEKAEDFIKENKLASIEVKEAEEE